MHTSLITTMEDLTRLAPQWRDLAQRARVPPFQWPEWHDAWFKTMGRAAGWAPRVAICMDGDRLIGVMPMALRRSRGLRLLDWSAADVTDRCDVIVDPGRDTRAIAHVLWETIRKRGGFDIARFSQVAQDSRAAAIFAGDATTLRRTLNSYSLPITWRSGSAWVKAQPSKARQDIGRRTRRLGDADVSFRICAPVDRWEPVLEALIQQKCAASQLKGRETFVTRPGAADFLRAISTTLLDRKMLHLSSLRSRNKFVSCHIGFTFEGTYYSYLTSYDPASPAHSPGQTILAHVIMWCCDSKLSAIDMLMGGDEYKVRLGCEAEPMNTYVRPATPLGHLGFMAYCTLRPNRFRRGDEAPQQVPAVTKRRRAFSRRLGTDVVTSAVALELLPRLL